MQTWNEKKHKFYLYNFLSGLVKALEGQHTVIDLRNESCVSGLIKHVDGLMNVEMENVVFYDQHGREHKFADFYVHSRNIRYVHIPEGLSPIELMEEHIEHLQKPMSRPSRKDNFKTKRAKRYNAETVKSLNDTDPQPSTSKTT